MDLTLKLPEIPKGLTPEMYNYYVQLHNNLRILAAAINALQKG